MTRKNLWFVALVVVLMAVLVAGCTQTAAPAATTAKPAASPAASPAGGAAANGQAVFTTNCNGCHPGGGQGTGPSIKNSPLTEAQIKTQVRNGKGQMPPFSAAQIPDPQLDALAAYVKTLK
ncbi:MAG: c-type cytochrome [Chloroflexota bacterium]